jgi:nicotinamidase/pyrazinamidase
MVTIQSGDALLIVDIQKDFLPGGRLAIADGNDVLPVLLSCISTFESRGLPIFATRDWHPQNHRSFTEQGGVWPIHCVADSPGAKPPSSFRLPSSTVIVTKGTAPETEGYSGFQGTKLDAQLKEADVRRLFVGGLATDYCVLNTVKDALNFGYQVYLLSDAIRAVNLQPNDGSKAIEAMRQQGAILIESKEVAN